MCNTINSQQHQSAADNESCCSVVVAAAAGPALALGAHIAANGSAERYVTIVQDLYRANHLPCPDMQLLLQYCALSVDDMSCMMPIDDRANDNESAIPDVVEDVQLECEPIGYVDYHEIAHEYEDPYTWFDEEKFTGLKYDFSFNSCTRYGGASSMGTNYRR